MSLREEILATCFSRYEGEFADGDQANNKLDMEKIYDNPELFEEVTLRLGQVAMEHDPEFIVGVPDGATRLADAVASYCGLFSAHLRRTGSNKDKVEFKDNFLDGKVICGSLSRGVLVEDVFNKFTSTNRVLAVPELSERIVAVEAIWDRGSDPRSKPDVPARALIKEHVPSILPADSRFWGFAANG